MDEEDMGAEPVYELPSDQDWLLTQLVQWAELGVNTGVTLFVNGNVVSGMLSSEGVYIRRLRREFADGLGDGAVAAPIDRAFASILEGVDALRQEEGPIPYPRYAHLTDAQVFAPGSDPLPSKQAISLRIKIASVDSFSLGKMAQAK
ncbi:hypothetical protein ACFSC3_19195 [Sphingomonas floccifaciens]|uniref:Uncharacterized protein n=1 Tax=Sphingomonas floccifaciens TaxID=1844115 RepID=A0ABW4NK31_9SPHN